MTQRNISLYMYNIDSINLLDLVNDISNIIGDYVKRDNLDKISNDSLKILKQNTVGMTINKL